MTKGLITAIGLVVSLGVVALGFFFVALPIYVQSIGVDAQTTTVVATNALYSTEVDNLRVQEDSQEELDASVAALRAQIPADGQLDDVFEVVGRAAAASQVTIVSITAGEGVPFVERTGLVDENGESVPNPDAATVPDDAATDGATPAPSTDGVVVTGRQQVDFTIQVNAPDMDRATAFLDALRTGPRLVGIAATTAVNNGGGAIGLQVSALTFVDSEGEGQ